MIDFVANDMKVIQRGIKNFNRRIFDIRNNIQKDNRLNDEIETRTIIAEVENLFLKIEYVYYKNKRIQTIL